MISEQVVTSILNNLDNKIWENKAQKAVIKMAPFKITMESNKILSDFTFLNSVMSKGSVRNIAQVHDNVSKISQNYILGTIKIVQRRRSKTQQNKQMKQTTTTFVRKTTGKKVKTTSYQEDFAANIQPKKNNFFRLPSQEKEIKEQQSFEQKFRLSKKSDLTYFQSIENAYRANLAERQFYSTIQRKRLKEMKTFTYDFQGKFLSTNQFKKKKQLNAPKINSQISQQVIPVSKKVQQQSQEKVKEVVQKHLVQTQRGGALSDFIKKKKEKLQQQQQKEKQHKKTMFEKGILGIKVMDVLKQQDKISVGVHITDLGSKQKISGRNRDKSKRKNLNLEQFKGQNKQLEHLSKNKLQQALKTSSYFKTQPDSSNQRERFKTQTDYTTRQNFRAFRKVGKSRGIIRVSNKKLYSQNFCQTIQY